jgi:peroxiredoxin
MRFDESSARYALFGDFYFGYILPPVELVKSLRLVENE